MFSSPKKAVAKDRETRLSLMQMEYNTLRAEILAAYGYAQSIVRWILATFAAVTSVGVVAIGTGLERSLPLLQVFALAIFAVGLPGMLWLSAWTWLGELFRAERCGAYLRRLEQSISDLLAPGGGQLPEPVRWERFIVFARAEFPRGPWGKQIAAYLGTSGVFFGTNLGCLLILFLTLLSPDVQRITQISTAWIVTIWIVTAVTHFVGVIVCLGIYQKLMQLQTSTVPLPDRIRLSPER